MASIKAVAKEAGVSVATVSRVISGGAAVSQKRRDAVLAAIEKVNYTPNIFGKRLRGGKTGIIMVMLSSLANTFCSSVIRAIDNAAGEQGYYTVTCTTDGKAEKEEYYTNFACNGIFDGIIILNSSLDKEKIEVLSKKIPVVQCNEYVDAGKVPFVSIDNRRAAYEAVKLLISHGRQRVVFHTVDNNLISTKERLKGYRDALSETGIPFDETLMVYGNYGYRNSIETFRDFLNQGIPFDAVFAISDRMAAGAVHSIRAKGYGVPEEIEVVGFDNTDIAHTFTPNLTTVGQPHALLGRNAFMLIEKIIEGKETKNVVLPHEIIVRHSTKQED